MPRDLKAILKLRVPIVVRLGHRRMHMENVLALAPGALIELPRPATDPLDLMVNNVAIGQGRAVKIGENFGLRVTLIGAIGDRVQAMSAGETPPQT